jgi:hypothetical protein
VAARGDAEANQRDTHSRYWGYTGDSALALAEYGKTVDIVEILVENVAAMRGAFPTNAALTII